MVRDDSTLDQDARELQRAFSELVRVYQFRDRQRICYYDLSVTECHALGAIVASGPMTLRTLASSLYLDKSTVSRVVDALEAKGYATRGTSAADARALRLEATAAGRGIHERIEEDLIEEARAIAADFPPEIRRETTRLIDRLREAAVARFQGNPGG